MRFQVVTAASMKFRSPTSGMMKAARTSETSVDNYFTRQYIPQDNSERIKYVRLIMIAYKLFILTLRMTFHTVT
jgi:hypothetical protein